MHKENINIANLISN